MKLKLVNLGRGKVNAEIQVSSMSEAESKIRECLVSRNVDIQERKETPGHYDVFAGFHKVGEAIVTQ